MRERARAGSGLSGGCRGRTEKGARRVERPRCLVINVRNQQHEALAGERFVPLAIRVAHWHHPCYTGILLSKSSSRRFMSSEPKYDSDSGPNPPWYTYLPDGRFDPGGIPERLLRHPELQKRGIVPTGTFKPVRQIVRPCISCAN